MSFRHGSRVKATSTTTGTGTLTLVDAAAEFRTFDGAYGAGPAKVQYVIRGTTYYEIGIGTWDTAANTLARDSVIVSSAGTSQVSLPTATHDIFVWEAGSWPSDVLTGSPSLTITDLFSFQLYAGTGGTMSLPALSTLPRGIAFPFLNRGSGTLTIDPNSTDPINGQSTLSVGVGQGGWLFIRDTATVEWCAIMGVAANPAATDVAQTFTAAQAISGSGLTPLTLTSTDAGATEGPIVDAFRDSASPAANDLIAALHASGRSSTGVKRQFAKILAQILDATNASEDATLLLQTIVAGTLATRASLGQGLFMAGATGGDPGAGKVNATGLQVNGTEINLLQLAKCLAYVTVSAGVPTLAASLNITGITDTATGRLTITIDVDFAGVNWFPLCSTEQPSAGTENIVNIRTGTIAAGSIEITASALGGTDADPASWTFVGFGT